MSIGDLNNELGQYSNGQKQLGCQIIRYLIGGLSNRPLLEYSNHLNIGIVWYLYGPNMSGWSNSPDFKWWSKNRTQMYILLSNTFSI